MGGMENGPAWGWRYVTPLARSHATRSTVAVLFCSYGDPAGVVLSSCGNMLVCDVVYGRCAVLIMVDDKNDSVPALLETGGRISHWGSREW